jgi:hypothetical protein
MPERAFRPLVVELGIGRDACQLVVRELERMPGGELRVQGLRALQEIGRALGLLRRVVSRSLSRPRPPCGTFTVIPPTVPSTVPSCEGVAGLDSPPSGVVGFCPFTAPRTRYPPRQQAAPRKVDLKALRGPSA